MAGIGEFNTLTREELREAFDRARDAGHDYLVLHTYTSDGAPMGLPGMGFLVEMIDFNQAATGVSLSSASQDILGIYRRHGALNIDGVYDLKAAFDSGVMQDESILPQAALRYARAVIDGDKAAAEEKARPWWKKLPVFRI